MHTEPKASYAPQRKTAFRRVTKIRRRFDACLSASSICRGGHDYLPIVIFPTLTSLESLSVSRHRARSVGRGASSVDRNCAPVGSSHCKTLFRAGAYWLAVN
ncbi:hypothetical protein BaRGS_00038031 [Batillaria attramentaria]|uniref:Uncharacterized protein n=1 Tax=Batillaria attramentaria TaxID=370345 RepID=A0ABD0J8F7_9CAEN